MFWRWALGCFLRFYKYSKFGINIFDYADVFDFLIAPFSDYRILLFTAISLALTYVFFKLDLLWKNKFPRFYSKIYFGLDKKTWFNSVRYFSFSILFISYLYTAADIYGALTKQQILNQPTIQLRYTDNESKSGKMIGKTKEVIFLLTNDKVQGIPINTLVKEFEIKN